MTIKQLLLQSTKLKNSTSPHLDAEVLLSFVLKKPKEHLFTYPEKSVPKKISDKYLKLIKQRSTGIPVAYLTGEKHFYSYKFKVTKDTLIPRPKTEDLVDLAVKELKNRNNLRILDVGTGPGTIIIALAKTLGSTHRYFASDISKKALTVAKHNAKATFAKITFVNSDLMNKLQNQTFDVIIANLPYLKAKIDPSIKFEPTLALVSKNNGLDHYQRLIEQLKSNPPKYLFLEADKPQHAILKKLAKQLKGTHTVII